MASTLISLSIDNVAVIEKADVEFEKGFNVLTGETGAGKSLLIDSLSMVLGMRTSRDLVRSSAESASVSALFASAPDFEDLGIEPEEDGSILLSRKLYSDGRNICKINSKPVSLSLLRAVGERLVTIHGQNANILLMKPTFHLELLDEYAKNHNLLSEYKALFQKSSDAKKALENAVTDESEREQKKDILSFRINEVSSVAPTVGEDDSLTCRRDALRNFSNIKLALESASDAFSSVGGVVDLLHGAMKGISAAEKSDNTLSSLSERITDLYYTAEDIASEISSASDNMVLYPGELDEVEERLDALTRLKKKYALTIEGCLEALEKWQAELDSLTDYEANIARLEKEACDAENKMLALGRKLDESRKSAALLLSEKVMHELTFLDMPKVKFSVEFHDVEPNIHGLSSAEFMISTNPSEALKPLSKIASGGEMSRIMLAIKSALSDCDSVSTLLFDEVDSGVSGRAALKIASKLKSLAENKQVICVTHLPQLAAKADSHLLVYKDTSSDDFRTYVTRLDKKGRTEEVARLISGDISKASLSAAEEMLGASDSDSERCV
jgi:DNA repair protein RecN (Recombination protein N)